MKSTTYAAIIAIAVTAVFIQRVSSTREVEPAVPPSAADDRQPSSQSLKGTIVSVEEQSSYPPKSGLRRAVVKLDSGETVQAWVPSACVVFPGYLTRLVKSADGAGATFMVAEGPNDS